MFKKITIITLIFGLITTQSFPAFPDDIFKAFKFFQDTRKTFFQKVMEFLRNRTVVYAEEKVENQKAIYEKKFLSILNNENVYGFLDKEGCHKIESLYLKFCGRFFNGIPRHKDFIKEDMSDYIDEIFGKFKSEAHISEGKRELYEKMNDAIKHWGEYPVHRHSEFLADLVAQAGETDQKYLQKLFEEYEYSLLLDAVKKCERRGILK